MPYSERNPLNKNPLSSQENIFPFELKLQRYFFKNHHPLSKRKRYQNVMRDILIQKYGDDVTV